jgi:hypothetical protein
MSNVSVNLTNLDFESIKNNLKEYLKTQKVFQDYDFEGSNINVLLDVLAYNSHLTAFYLNMIGNEMFLDSALLRDSVVSHAKELNYLPRSFRSATTLVDIIMEDTSTDVSSIIIPKGTSFTGKMENRSFTFVTDQNIPASSQGNNLYKAENVTLYEGDYVYDSYIVDYSNPTRFLITNKTIDTNSITVTSLEDNGSVSVSYQKADSLFGLNQFSQVFFIQAAENDSYEIVFGDNVIGRKPKDRSIVIIEYRSCNGELPNGLSTFTADSDLGTARFVRIFTKEKASGGSIPEGISSIKFNAPRSFTTQERVVSARDYETLLLNNFSEINAVSAYGGEEFDPPQFGKVIIAVDLKNTNRIPPSKANEYKSFIKQRSPLSIDPIFIEPEYTYVKVNTRVKYNINQSSLNINDIQTLVFSSVQDFNLLNLNGFNKTLFYSRLVSTIDNAQLAIISNDTELLPCKSFIPNIGLNNIVLDFGFALRDDLAHCDGDNDFGETLVTLQSTPFIVNERECFLEDDGKGTIHIMTTIGGRFIELQSVGKINYETGFVQITDMPVSRITTDALDIFVRAKEKDIMSQKKTILSIRDKDINVRVLQVRE